MRILSVIDGLGGGGAELSLLEISEGLIDRGHEIRLAYLYDRSETGLSHATPSLSATRTSSKHLAGKVIDVVRLVRATHPDVMHTTLFDASLVGRIAGRITGTPTVTSLVTMASEADKHADPRLRRRRAVVRQLERVLARFATTRFHAVSQAVAMDASRRLRIPSENIAVVYRGRSRGRLPGPSDALRREVRLELGEDDSSPVVLAVGRHESPKGFETLLRAFALVVERLATPPRLWLAGREGLETKRLEKVIEDLGLDRHVRLLGHRDDVGYLMGAADVFCLPSRWEGMPGTLIEAMAMGLAPVATDIPPVREVLGDGLVDLVQPVAVGDEALMARALTRLLDDAHLRRSVAAAGRRRFADCFEIERSVDGMESLFHEVVQSRR